eukprot:GEMP01073256.1.p1 GENE.GEMP01073256.1~~GEMP01073256.1.p1  ORF type:complete len:210 (+),score=55.89 GEMP01073256.1:96-725(+)
MNRSSVVEKSECPNCLRNFRATEATYAELARLEEQLEQAWSTYEEVSIHNEEAQAVATEAAVFEAAAENCENEVARVSNMAQDSHRQELAILEDLIQQEEQHITKLTEALKQCHVDFLPYQIDGDVSQFVDERESLMKENIEFEEELEHLSAHLIACQDVGKNLPKPLDDAGDPEEEALIDEALALKTRIEQLNSGIDFRERIMLMKKP